MTTRYLICGGREFEDYALMEKALRALILHPEDAVVIQGAARGADTLAARWAQCNGVPCEAYPANWELHGRAAGPIRNQQMLDEGKPDVVIAFPGSAGTRDMVMKARKAGLVAICVTGHNDPPGWRGFTTGEPENA
jgi:cysteine synthase